MSMIFFGGVASVAREGSGEILVTIWIILFVESGLSATLYHWT